MFELRRFSMRTLPNFRQVCPNKILFTTPSVVRRWAIRDKDPLSVCLFRRMEMGEQLRNGNSAIQELKRD